MTSHEVYIWTYDSWIFDFPQTISKIVDAAHKYDQVILKLSEGPAIEHLTYLDTKLIDILKNLCSDNNWPLNKFIFITHNPVQDPKVWPDIKWDSKFADFFLSGKSIKYDPKKKIIKYHFGCFINGSTWNRLWLSAFLFENFRSKTLQTFRRDLNNKAHAINLDIDRLCFEFAGEKDTKKNFVVLANFLQQIPIEIHKDSKLLKTEHFTWPESMHQELLSCYDQLFVDIVCETFSVGSAFQPSEKIARPLLTKNPFIVFGPVNFLRNLKQLGFRSFNKFWDETYDDFAGVARINAIEILIQKIAKCGKIELNEIYNKMLPILEHNYCLYHSVKKQDIIDRTRNLGSFFQV